MMKLDQLEAVSAAPDETHRIRQPASEEGLERLVECMGTRFPVMEAIAAEGGNLTSPTVKAAMYKYLDKVISCGRRSDSSSTCIVALCPGTASMRHVTHAPRHPFLPSHRPQAAPLQCHFPLKKVFGEPFASNVQPFHAKLLNACVRGSGCLWRRAGCSWVACV